MSRPLLEVADIFREHGRAWRDANRGHVSLDQLKVMSAIARCRTSALGGQRVDQKRELPAPSNPMACARKLVEAEFAHDEHPLLVQQGGQFYGWDGAAWPPLDDKDVRTMSAW